jgi:beta-glucosidase
VMACAKHFALNSMENARFSVDVSRDEATLHETYLPHFRRVVEEGVYAVMSAYNSVNGQWCGQNEPLLTGVLRDQWGFRGVVVSDFVWGLRDAVLSLRAGLDVEEPFRQQRAQHLPAALEDGRASWADVEGAGVRMLGAQLRHARRWRRRPRRWRSWRRRGIESSPGRRRRVRWCCCAMSRLTARRCCRWMPGTCGRWR